jgi:hypothetical protein
MIKSLKPGGGGLPPHQVKSITYQLLQVRTKTTSHRHMFDQVRAVGELWSNLEQLLLGV